MVWPHAERCTEPPSRKYRRKWADSSWRPFIWREEGDRGAFPNTRTRELASRTPAEPGIYEFAISRTFTSNTK